MADAIARWSPARARRWMGDRGWRVGCNFIPSTACNALEMWQGETFDLDTIERELGFAAALGFTSVRVFLHDLVWETDRQGFLRRLDRFLEAAAAHRIGALLVFFDGVWNPHPERGPQAPPRARVHNAGWVQSPGAAILGDSRRQDALRTYVQGVLDALRDDTRVDGWDLFNEPDNPNFAYAKEEIPDKGARALELLGKTFAWAREVAPSQPLTAGVWRGSWRDPGSLSQMDRLCLDASDVVSFHHYGELEALEQQVAPLRRYERPLLCTEFVARGIGSTFDPHLAWLKSADVGAYCWGLVAGRTQTQYPWDSWIRPYDAEPDPWHHDILRPDGTPWSVAEVDYIRSVTR